MIRSWNRIDPRSRGCSKQKSLAFLNFPKINKQLSQREEELSARVSSVPVFLTRSTKQPARGRNYRGNAARFQAIRAPLRRETMNNGTSRFAQLNASVRIRERWNSRRSSGSHKRERSGRSYLPGSIASHLPLRESVELVIDILGGNGRGGRNREIQSDDLVSDERNYCSTPPLLSLNISRFLLPSWSCYFKMDRLTLGILIRTEKLYERIV